MSAVQRTDEAAGRVEAAASSSDSKITTAVPAIVTTINRLQAEILKAGTLEEARAKARELDKALGTITDGYSELYRAASDVSELASPFLRGEKPQFPSKREGVQARKQAMEAVRELDTVRQRVSGDVVEREVTVTPNYLPEVQGISASLKKLSGSLHALMTDALNPDKQADIESLKSQLADHRGQFEELGAHAASLQEPVSDKAVALDKFIEDTRDHTAKIAIARAVCDWELARIDIFANALANLDALQQNIAGLNQDVEDLKSYLRENPYKDVDPVKLAIRAILDNPGERTLKAVEEDIAALIAQYPESAPGAIVEALSTQLKEAPETKISDAADNIRAVLAKLPESAIDKATRDFAAIVRKYNEYKGLAEEHRDAAEAAIASIIKMLGDAEKDLIADVNKIPFHDPDVQSLAEKEMKQEIARMQSERESLLSTLRQKWKVITDQLTNNSRDHLLYEVNREGYAIFVNRGQPPKDFTFNMWGFGWNPEQYVKAMAPKKDEGAASSSSQ